MTEAILRIGARGSPLSLAQTGLVARLLEEANPGLATNIIPIKTSGDKMIDTPLSQIGGKGLFVKEIEEALLAGHIDLAVHSAKDLPAELPEGLTIGAVPRRADFRDMLITRHPGGWASLPKGARVGTSGLRRQAQLLAARPDLLVAPIRGNVDTRLKKLENEFDATLLAAAGLSRLGLQPKNAEFLPTEVMLPSSGQGSLALEARVDDLRVLQWLAPVNHQASTLSLAAERGFLRRLGSSCQLPVAALAQWTGGTMILEGLIASPDGRRVLRDRQAVDLDSVADAANLGLTLASGLMARGGQELLKELDLL